MQVVRADGWRNIPISPIDPAKSEGKAHASDIALHEKTGQRISVAELRLNIGWSKTIEPDEGQEYSDVLVGVP